MATFIWIVNCVCKVRSLIWFSLVGIYWRACVT